MCVCVCVMCVSIYVCVSIHVCGGGIVNVDI